MDWDELARPWLEAAPHLEQSFQEVFDALFATAELKAGEKVLDVGCGTGPTLIRASEAVGENGRVVGIDVAPPLVKRAAERVSGNVDLIVGDASLQSYETETFDAIIANFGVMFFEDNIAAFKNLRQAVPTGGRLVATVWSTMSDNPWFAIPRQIVEEIVEEVPVNPGDKLDHGNGRIIWS